MREFVPIAVTLIELAGGHVEAVQWVQALQQRGVDALRELGLTTDVHALVEEQTKQVGLVNADGAPNRSRLAQLLLVIDILSATPEKPLPKTPVEPLVYTVPEEAAHLVDHRQRLDLYIGDIIRSATETLHLGAPFWNAGGFEQLTPVLEPALRARAVDVHVYAHRRGQEWDAAVDDFVRGLGGGDRLTLWWYAGGRTSLMHAKFCVADRTAGYLGTANLTSFGLSQHIEVGVPLSAPQCADLVRMLDALTAASLFRRQP